MSTPETGPLPVTPVMRVSRWVLGTVGVVGGLYGAWLLLDRQDFTQLRSVAVWLIGGVVANDGVIAAMALVAMFVGGRLLPAAVQAPAAVGFVVLGTVTVVAIPVLGAFGAREDNATLLPKNYGLGWVVFAAIVLVLVVVASVLRLRQDRASTHAGSGSEAGSEADSAPDPGPDSGAVSGPEPRDG